MIKKRSNFYPSGEIIDYKLPQSFQKQHQKRLVVTVIYLAIVGTIAVNGMHSLSKITISATLGG